MAELKIFTHNEFEKWNKSLGTKAVWFSVDEWEQVVVSNERLDPDKTRIWLAEHVPTDVLCVEYYEHIPASDAELKEWNEVIEQHNKENAFYIRSDRYIEWIKKIKAHHNGFFKKDEKIQERAERMLGSINLRIHRHHHSSYGYEHHYLHNRPSGRMEFAGWKFYFPNPNDAMRFKLQWT